MHDKATTGLALELPSDSAMKALFVIKYGNPESTGSGPATRYRFGYYNPDDYYEALIESLVTAETKWLDIGCGRKLFPSNPQLAQKLSGICKTLFGVDPDVTIQENPYVHGKHQGTLETLATEERFNLITMRMVAEHVDNPPALIAEIDRLTEQGAKIVVYTVYKWSPIPLLTDLVPFSMRHIMKKFLWGTEEKDTFPTCYRMNTRKILGGLFAAQGFREKGFFRLSDCRTFSAFHVLYTLELWLWRLLGQVGLRYPEQCIIGIYEKL